MQTLYSCQSIHAPKQRSPWRRYVMNILQMACTALVTFFILIPAHGDAAIAFDSTNKYSTCSGTSCSLTFVNTAGDFLSCDDNTYTSTPGAMTWTYNGASMTQVGTEQTSTLFGNNFLDVFRLSSPTTGSHTIAITTTNSVGGFNVHCATYAGTNTSSPVEAVTQTTTSSGGAYTASITVTTVTDNAWAVGHIASNAGRTLTGGSGTTVRTFDSQGAVYDSNSAKHPAGAYTLNIAVNANDADGLIAYSLKPASAATTVKIIQQDDF